MEMPFLQALSGSGLKLGISSKGSDYVSDSVDHV